MVSERVGPFAGANAVEEQAAVGDYALHLGQVVVIGGEAEFVGQTAAAVAVDVYLADVGEAPASEGGGGYEV